MCGVATKPGGRGGIGGGVTADSDRLSGDGFDGVRGEPESVTVSLTPGTSCALPSATVLVTAAVASAWPALLAPPAFISVRAI